ncbi:MAG: zinc-binding dehydrogenase [Acidimicrobiia bacterium]|nr:zinc-binding dehydrogenase [Acidimicrobiia bacterium]
MKALLFRRSEVRYVAAVVAGRLARGEGARVGPLALSDIDPPELPGPGWRRVTPMLSGICGSDLATVDGHASRYFEPLVSFPFVPGHEVVGRLEDGSRVVLEPVLGHVARGFEPPFADAAPGDGDDYGHLIAGPLEPGIQIGYCASTGGGWSTQFVAHESQLHRVPDAMSDEAAVMVEPAAVGVHAALRADVGPGATVAVIGAGTMGLLSVAGLKYLVPGARVIVGAKYPHQRALATALGADLVVEPASLKRTVRRAVGCRMIGEDLAGGADATIDTLGTSTSIRDAIGVTRPRGRVVLVGMPATVRLELTALWHRETELVGTYTYCTEKLPDGARAKAFAIALDLAQEMDLGRLVSATYPLDRFVDAIRHAANAGRRASVKVAFDLRGEKHRA